MVFLKNAVKMVIIETRPINIIIINTILLGSLNNGVVFNDNPTVE